MSSENFSLNKAFEGAKALVKDIWQGLERAMMLAGVANGLDQIGISADEVYTQDAPKQPVSK
jgi:hypothetical protein